MKNILCIFIMMLTMGLSLQAQHAVTYNRFNHSVEVAVMDTTLTHNMSLNQIFYDFMGINTQNHFIKVDSMLIRDQLYVLSFDQYYNNCRVSNAKISLFYNHDKLFRILGNYLPITNLDTAGSITFQELRAIYLNHFSISDTNNWEIYFEKKIVVNPDTTQSIANPALLTYQTILTSFSQTLSVNAHTGEVLGELSSCHFDHPPVANLETYYYGNREAEVEFDEPLQKYALQDATRNIYMYKFNYNGTEETRFTDTDLEWTEQEHTPWHYAHDVFWSIQKIYDYFKDTYNYSGYAGSLPDHPLNIYLNYNPSNLGMTDNSGYITLYSTPFGHELHAQRGQDRPWETAYPCIVIGPSQYLNPMATIDVIAHEFAHGFDEFNTDFLNSFELQHMPIAEALSDVWGAIIKSIVLPEQNPWKHGEGIFEGTQYNSYSCFRNLAIPDDPSAFYPMTDFLSDDLEVAPYSAAVYYCSGVLSHLFYLLVEGGQGTNADGYCYSIEGIGMEKVAQLLFNSQTNNNYNINPLYLQFSSGAYHYFAPLRRGFVLAAEDLWGINSTEVEQLKEAFTAVGIYLFEYTITYSQLLELFPNISPYSSSEEWDDCILVPHGTTLTLDHKIGIANDIYVGDGATLTVKNTVKLNKNSYLYIENGGKLILDGATLTSSCPDEKWNGIKVVRNFHNSEAATQIIMTNNAVIENAKCGIEFENDEGMVNAVVKANNSSFINNLESIKIGIGWDNLLNNSYFNNCNFIINENYIAGNVPFRHHVLLSNIKGINFKSCRFENHKQTSNTSAIVAYDAGFSVKNYCPTNHCFINTGQRSYFSGFDKAIVAENNGLEQTFSVFSADFENNTIGIEASSVNRESILNCNFTIGKQMQPEIPGDPDVPAFAPSPAPSSSSSSPSGTYFPQASSYGIKLFKSTGFRVEENYFHGVTYSYTDNYGIYVEESGDSENEVYKNHFENLYVAQACTGKNRSEGLSYKGLQSLCNIFDIIAHRDILVSPKGSGPNDGIRVFQGGSWDVTDVFHEYSAGNKFSTNATYQIDNENTSHILYFYHAPTSREYPDRKKGYVYPYATSANSCPSKISPILVEDHREALRVLVEEGEEGYNNITYLYHNLIDAGNTEELIEQVQGEWGDDVWRLRKELLAKSPYISQEVLCQVAKDNLLPQALYLEVCLANPEATKDRAFLKFLQHDIINPLPNYMIGIIESSWSNKTDRTQMEAMIANFSAIKEIALNHYLGSLLMDTLDYSAEIATRLLDRGNLSDVLSVASSEISHFQYSTAKDRLYALLEDPVMLRWYEQELYDFIDYINYRESLQGNDKSIYALDSADLITLQEFATSHTGLAQHFANNILCYIYDLCP
ncbi:MAG: M4 family metallopeptidase, partial [Bacteroidales bacterium]|nr:M4 family metallopeptidase [Bacteroidales bacterium]